MRLVYRIIGMTEAAFELSWVGYGVSRVACDATEAE